MRPYDLEQRSFEFAKECRLLIRKLPRNLSNFEDGKQLIRSSGSIGANYIEANENLGEKDFKFKLKISRKEAKESAYWLNLLLALNADYKEEITFLKQEAEELRKILSAILNKV